MDRIEIINKAESYVRKLYEAKADENFVYHNLEHVELVVKAAIQISNYYNLHLQDFKAVLLAAWFHDVGYLFGCITDHEEKSTEQAAEFLEEQREDPDLVKKVKECIRATKIFTEPASLIAKIVSDADLFHLGTADFWESNLRMKQEMERCFGERISTYEWQKGTLKLLESHQYHSEYCQNSLKGGKQENINLLRKWLVENESDPQNGKK